METDVARALQAKGALVTYPTGDVIFAEEDPAAHAYLILTGQAERFVYDPQHGLQARTQLLAAGACLGLEELLCASPRETNARALTTVRARRLSLTELLDAMRDHEGARRAVLSELGRTHARTVQWGREMAFANIEQRIARYLVEHAQHHQALGLCVSQVATLESIAQVVGASPRSVQRVFGRWRQSGWIARLGPHLQLLAPRQLRTLARQGTLEQLMHGRDEAHASRLCA